MSLLDAAWNALGESPELLASVERRGSMVPLTAVLPVGEFVHDAIATAALTFALERDSPLEPIVLDPARVATAVTSERWFRRGGEPWMPWAALSGFWRASDGWVRTHANYDHHRARLLEALGLPLDAGPALVADAILHQRALEVEEHIVTRDGIAAAVRSAELWRQHPHARAVAAQPLIGLRSDGMTPPPLSRRTRVLDLTRVIAGPVATRTLALSGADVLRVDPPGLAEPAEQHLDTGAGKRSVILSVDDAEFARLLAEADVLVTGYRPGALDRHGLSAPELAQRHPTLVVASLSAWGATGPFGRRRGFDSIVQAATGIATIEGDADRPGALPAQALDHAAGYLLAAGISTALRRRSAEGGSWRVEVSLARVAHELLGHPRRLGPPAEHAEFAPTTVHHGDREVAAPALPGFDDWPAAAVPLGSSATEWLDDAS